MQELTRVRKYAVENKGKKKYGTLKVFGALVVSFVIINAITFAYNHDPKWLKRDGGATKGVYAPGHFILRSDEGFGAAKIDENGYINRSSNIGKDYVLILGKSHTNGSEVIIGERYVDILDDRLFEEQGRHAYAVSRGGSTFADLLSGFRALTEEFPDSSAIIIEMTYLDSAEDYELALNQRSFNEKMKASYLNEHQSFAQELEGCIKEYFPAVAYVVNYRIPSVKLFDKNAFFQASNPSMAALPNDNSETELESSLGSIMKTIRAEYDGQIVVLYHPEVSLCENGEMKIDVIPEYDILVECCASNDIELCYMGKQFLDAYQSNYTVPYGFWNTSMGEGHLNRSGHKLIADVIFDEFLSKAR